MPIPPHLEPLAAAQLGFLTAVEQSIARKDGLEIAEQIAGMLRAGTIELRVTQRIGADMTHTLCELVHHEGRIVETVLELRAATVWPDVRHG